MMKKSGFLKHGTVLRRMFMDKSGDLDRSQQNWIDKKVKLKEEELDKLGKTKEQILDEIRTFQNDLIQQVRREQHDTDKEFDEWKGGDRIKKEEKWKITRAKEWFDGKRKRAKEVMRGDIAGAGGEVGGWMFIMMAVMLYMFDIYFNYNGINIQRFLDNLYFTSIESYIGWFFNSVVLTLLIAYYVIYRPNPQEFISWFLVAETLSLIIFMGGMGSSLIHLSFVIAFYFLYIRYAAPEGNKASANYIFFFLLAFDFFGFGILAELVRNPIVSNRLIIPIWFYFALIYTHEKERSFWINLVIIIVILMNVFYFVGGINGLKSMSATLTDEEKQEGINFIRTGWNNVKDTFSKVIEGFRADIENQIIYASGGYYKGKVERNKIGPLGVFIDKLKASQPRYYENEDVIIWGTLKALSLGDNVNIKMSCHKKGEEKYSTKTTPNIPFTIYSKETRDFECVFEEGKMADSRSFLGKALGGIGFDPNFPPGGVIGYDVSTLSSELTPGIHTISVDAEFGFETLAYLKSYFMDIERKRSMVGEGLDPFKEFGITDTEPIAVYTDGPVIMGMEMTSPIIEVGEGIVTQPRIGITLENKEGWEGIIRSLTELVILTPHGIKMDLEDEPCTVDFEKYELEKDCKQDSCVNLAFKPCVEVCELNKKKDCQRECGKIKTSCEKDCDILFKGDKEGETYNGYKIDVNAEQWLVLDIFKDIDRYRSFSCRLTVASKGDDSVLGNTPLTVKYFRAKARYNYTLSKDIDVQIQSKLKPGTAVKVSEKIDISTLVPRNIGEKIKIITNQIITSYPIGFDKVDMALALAWTESSHRHCCEGATGSSCKGTEEDSCAEGKLISSGSSFGVMQLNKEVHCQWFNPGDMCEGSTAKGGVDYSNYGCKPDYTQAMADGECKIYYEAGCGGKDATNVDCNIKLSLTLLKNHYQQYRGGIPANIITCKDQETKTKYLGYTGWDAALRAYNGMGCPDGASKNYVETVKRYMGAKPWENVKISTI